MTNDFEILSEDDIRKTSSKKRRLRRIRTKDYINYDERNALLEYARAHNLTYKKGGIEVFDEIAVRDSIAKECKPSAGNADYSYNVDGLFSENKSIINYKCLDNEWRKWNFWAKYDKSKRRTCLFLKLWFNKYLEYNDITISKKRIVYNDRHYAIRFDDILEDDGEIYDVNDYIKYTDRGISKYTRTFFTDEYHDDRANGTESKTIKEICWQYCSLFYHIGIKDTDLLFIHILWLIFVTVDIDSWIYEMDFEAHAHNHFTPLRLKEWIEMFIERGYKMTTLKQTDKHHFKKLYLEPGFEDIGKANYKEDKELKKVNEIKKAAEMIRLRNVELSNIEVYNEVRWRLKMTFRTFNSIVKKHNIDVGCKVKSEDRKVKAQFEFNVPDRFYDHTEMTAYTHKETIESDIQKRVEVPRKQHKQHKQHKQQERSKWHIMVENGSSYDEVIKLYPEVSNKTYRNYKCKIKQKNA